MATLTSSRKKPARISTTVRFDADLKRRAMAYARSKHMDFTTFLHQAVQSKIPSQPPASYYEISDEHNRQLDEMIARVDRGEEKTYGPFEGKAAIEFLESLM